MDMVRKYWSFMGRITSFLLVLVHFESLRILVQPKRYKYLFFTAMKIRIMARIGEETKQLYFQFTSYINLFHLYCQIWNNYTGTISAKILPLRCLYETVGLSVLFANSPCTFTSFCTIIYFQIKEKYYSNSLLISSIENFQFMIYFCLF